MKPLFKPKDGRVAVMLKCLEGLELNSSYRLSSIVYPAPPLAISTKGNKCCITLQTTSMPSFPAKIKADGYYFEVYIVWLDGKTTKYEWESKQTEWLPVDHKRLEIALEFDKPSWAKYRVVGVKVQGGEKEREIESFASMGMQVVRQIFSSSSVITRMLALVEARLQLSRQWGARTPKTSLL